MGACHRMFASVRGARSTQSEPWSKLGASGGSDSAGLSTSALVGDVGNGEAVRECAQGADGRALHRLLASAVNLTLL